MNISGIISLQSALSHLSLSPLSLSLPLSPLTTPLCVSVFHSLIQTPIITRPLDLPTGKESGERENIRQYTALKQL